MIVLVVDDIDEKAAQVGAVLEGCLPNGAVVVERARSVLGAVKSLSERSYDLLILDLVLPVRDGGDPIENGGNQVLAEILDGNSCRPPSHIICLTAFELMADGLRGEAERRLVHVVVFDEKHLRWQDALCEKAKLVEKRLEDAKKQPQAYLSDVLIVTSSPQVEFRAVSALPGFGIAEYNQSDALYYHQGGWTTRNGRKLSLVACAAPGMGMTAACATACKSIQRWRPRYLVMTGIAAGSKKKEQKYGDILVGEAGFDYGSGKIVQDSRGNNSFIPSPCQLAIDANLHSVLQKWEREQLRMKEIQMGWVIPKKDPPKLILGLIATGAAVVQNKKIVEGILANSRKVIGLDMEAYSMFHAAHLASKPRPRVLVAKAVSDFADAKKKDGWQAYSAYTSARFVFEFFTNADELEFSGSDN